MTMSTDTREALADAAAEFTKLTGCKWEVEMHLYVGPTVVDHQHRQGILLKDIKAALTGKLKRVRRGGVTRADFSDEPVGIVAWHKWIIEHPCD